jgi:hypothetical protein
MKFTTIFLEGNTIEVYNSLLGKETIKVNNQIVSEKSSFFGAEHIFSLYENGTKVECKIEIGFSFNGAVFNFYKNNKPIIISL